MIPLNQNLSTLKRSAIRVYSNLARETGDCAMLTIGEPDFDTPEAIRLAAIAALNANQTHYAPNQGTLPLREAIGHLPEDLRAVVILRYVTGLTLEETARSLGVPRGTVATRLRRALQLLRLELGEEGSDT